jgi:hypothetical protein
MQYVEKSLVGVLLERQEGRSVGGVFAFDVGA